MVKSNQLYLLKTELISKLFVEDSAMNHRPKAKIKDATFTRNLTIRRDWFRKQKKDKHQVKKWGNRVVVGKSNGCTRDPPSAPMFVPRTQGGLLARKLRELEVDLNRVGSRRVKIIEEGGTQLHFLA